MLLDWTGERTNYCCGGLCASSIKQIDEGEGDAEIGWKNWSKDRELDSTKQENGSQAT